MAILLWPEGCQLLPPSSFEKRQSDLKNKKLSNTSASWYGSYYIKVRSCTLLWTWVLRDIWFMISLTLYVWWRWCQRRAPDNSHTWHYSSFPGLLCDENGSKRNYSVKSLLMENINRDWSFIDHINCSHPPLFNTKMKKKWSTSQASQGLSYMKKFKNSSSGLARWHFFISVPSSVGQ